MSRQQPPAQPSAGPSSSTSRPVPRTGASLANPPARVTTARKLPSTWIFVAMAGMSYYIMTQVANGRIGSMEGKNKTSHPLYYDGEIAKDPDFVPNKSWRQKE